MSRDAVALTAAGAVAQDWWRRPPAAARVDRAVSSEAAFRLTVAFVVVVLVAPQTFVPGLTALRPAFLAAGLAIAAALGSRLMRHEPLSVSSRVLGISAVLLAWSVITIPLSIWPGGSVAMFAETFVKSLATCWLIANVAGTERRLTTLAWVLTLAIVPAAVSAVFDYRAGTFEAGRITGYRGGLTANPNDLALTLALIVPLTLALVAGTRRLWPRALLLGLVALMATAVILTFSRAGFLALAIAVLGCVWRFWRRRFPAVLTAGLVLLLGSALLPGGYVDRVKTLGDFDADTTGSVQQRWDDTAAALTWVATHPVVGAGLGQDVLALNQVRGAQWRVTHNVYVQYAVDLGLPGAALFIALLVAAIVTAHRAARARGRATRGAPDRVVLMAGGVEVALVAFAVAAVAYPAAYQLYAFILGGLAVATACARTAAPVPS